MPLVTQIELTEVSFVRDSDLIEFLPKEVPGLSGNDTYLNLLDDRFDLSAQVELDLRPFPAYLDFIHYHYGSDIMERIERLFPTPPDYVCIGSGLT